MILKGEVQLTEMAEFVRRASRDGRPIDEVEREKLKGSKAKQLSAVIGYLERNRRFMRYDEYLAAGFPIGSGVAEGACRHLVTDRMELTGMRWRVPGAQAMLDLRAVYLNGDWETFQQHRIKQERHRLYPYRSLVRRKRGKAAQREASYALMK